MKKYFLLFSLAASLAASAQETVYPAPKQKGPVVITNATVHVGNGQVLNNASIAFENGKITAVGASVTPAAGATVVNAQGKHVYPGLIQSLSNLGLVEINNVRSTNDVRELGELNPNIRSIVAYNTDSKVTNTLRTNGILLANVVPQGGLISGRSSVVQLDAWNWEDAVYKMDGGVHVSLPLLMPQASFLPAAAGAPDPVKAGMEAIDRMRSFFREAKAFHSSGVTSTETNLKFDAVKGLFDKTQKLFVEANTIKQILIAVDMAKEIGADLVIVGGADSWRVADLLKQNGVSVILSQSHSLPILDDDDVDQPYKTPAQLQKAGVLFAIADEDGNTRGRNLAFNAGTAVAYGLSKEEALQAVTLNAAKILGIADKTGSIEVGKDANIIVVKGDVLDMRSSVITDAFIQGRKIDLTDKHKQLSDRFEHKYELRK
ncbi:amidohydrolase family protein [Pseudocnuella soli]|uniref:amidohydrolase family protein n=1 Tax=Pseudocnuella soli TaxID=2502779 RepID=UPI0010474F65|nr:amidohydrolase family protein [Pseudocnuella soli]